MALKCAARGVAHISTPATSAMHFLRPTAKCGPWALSCCSTRAGAPAAAPSAAKPSSAGWGGRRRAAQKTKTKTRWGVLWVAKKSKAWRACFEGEGWARERGWGETWEGERDERGNECRAAIREAR